MLIYTIGFTKKSAERFFSLLSDYQIKRVIDTRLNPHGQLAGFSKKDDLRFFLKHLNSCDYVHISALAPTQEILLSFRKDCQWDWYTRRFEDLMDQRGVPGSLDRHVFEDGPVCLLCSEDSPEQCHRRLVAERLAREWPNVEIRHLV